MGNEGRRTNIGPQNYHRECVSNTLWALKEQTRPRRNGLEQLNSASGLFAFGLWWGQTELHSALDECVHLFHKIDWGALSRRNKLRHTC